jgi:hypothetical protein
MTTLFVLLAAVIVVATLSALVSRVVSGDGYGRRAHPPASHLPDMFATRGHPEGRLG